MNKKHRFKIRLLLKNGVKLKFKVKSTKDKIDEIFLIVDKMWKKEDNINGGYLFLEKTYISLAEIVTYEITPLRFYFF